MGMELTDKQTRALWAHALHEFAEAIAHYNAIVPTSVDIWIQHGATVNQALLMADSAPTPMPVRIVDNPPLAAYMTLTFPSAAELGLNITTHIHTDSELTESDLANIAWHNEQCCSGVAPDQHGSSDPEADITRCEKCGQLVPAEHMTEHLAARHGEAQFDWRD